MQSSIFLKRLQIGFFVALTIGLISLIVTFTRIPQNTLFIDGNVLRASAFNLTLSDSENNAVILISPLNDYVYTNSSKVHPEAEITSFNNGNVLQQLQIVLRDLVFNKKQLIWNTENKYQAISYVASQTNRGIKIKREISLKQSINSFGQVIKFCPDCLIADQKNRAYFNTNTLEQWNVDVAKRLNLTPIVVGENHFLPLDASLIRIIDRNGNLKLEIPIGKAQVYMQYKWRLLEFKAELSKGQSSVDQEIYLYK